MSEILICMLLSACLSYSMAITIVEKGRDWPIRKFKVLLGRWLNRHVCLKAHRVVNCASCASFWLAAISDIVVGVIRLTATGKFYFLWPLSGFIAVGLTYTIIEFMNRP